MGEKGLGQSLRELARAQGATRAWAVVSLPQALLDVKWVPVLGESPVEVVDLSCAVTAGSPRVVDVSACGPLGCAAVRAGADLAVADLGGLWVVAAGGGVDHDLTHALDEAASADPNEALARAREVHAAWRRDSDCAAAVAAYLACHPRVAEVRYPGLGSCEDHHRASCFLVGGFGPHVDYRLGTPSTSGSPWKRVDTAGGDPRALIVMLEEQVRP